MKIAHKITRFAPLGALALLAACMLDVGEVNITSGPVPGGPSYDTEAPADTDGGSEDTTTGSTGDAASADGSEGESTTGEAADDTSASEGSTGEPMGCTAPEHVACDQGTNDPFRAFGLNCPGELQGDASTSGPATARGILTSFGSTNAFAPREGLVYAVIGSGLFSDLNSPTPEGDSNQFPTHCNDDLGAFDPGGSLPAPISVDDPTLAGPFSAGATANDYSELRFSVQVPEQVTSFTYDFAYFSTEYPWYTGSTYNDIYIAWLESELWTGNMSFDGSGNPISINASFLEYTGDAPELEGTCMAQHAATPWLTTSAGVIPGENVTMVFGIFDAGDSLLDSYAFLDNFEWGCEDVETPVTVPG